MVIDTYNRGSQRTDKIIDQNKDVNNEEAKGRGLFKWISDTGS